MKEPRRVHPGISCHPPNAGNPPVDGAPSTDPSLTAAFPNAAVIAVTGFQFAVENPATIGSATSGAGTGKVKLDQLLIHKPVGKITASLFSASASGQHFGAIHLVLRRQAGTPQPVPCLLYEFQTVFITNIAWSGSSGDPDPAQRGRDPRVGCQQQLEPGHQHRGCRRPSPLQ